MKNIYSVLVYTVLLMSQLRGEDFFSTFKEADKRLEMLNAEIKWFLDYCAPTRQSVRVKSKEEENFYVKKWQGEHMQLIESVRNVQSEFFAFREKMADVLSVRFDQGRHGASLSAKTTLDLTKWYVKYIEDNLFPFGWEELYKEYLKEQKQENTQYQR
jgi:hypothetical protein